MVSQPGFIIWQQVDDRLANLMLADISEEFQRLAIEDLQHIRYQNMGNGNAVTIPSQRIEMHRLRTGELAARNYAMYCEVWQAQQKALTPEFLRAICPNRLHGLMSVRCTVIDSDLGLERMRTGRPDSEWLKAAMAEYKRSMDRLYAKWQRQAEIDATSLEHMLAATPSHPEVHNVAAQMVHARNQHRIVQARIISIETLIRCCEGALSATRLRPPDNYRIANLNQRLESLKTDKRHFETRRDEWNLKLNAASLILKDSVVAGASGISSGPTPGIAVSSIERRKRARPKPPCFAVVVELLKKSPDLTLVQVCRRIDSKAEQYPSVAKYKPPSSWRLRTFYEQYQKRSNTVSRFLSDVRAHIKNSSIQTK